MIIKEFESEVKHDKQVSEMSFIESNYGPTMEIFTRDKKEAPKLKGIIDGLRRIYNTDNAEKQNFLVTCDEKLGKVIITGNIFNAFNILKDNDLISSQFAEMILAASKVNEFLEQSKTIILPENRIEPKSLKDKEKDISSLTEDFVGALAKLDQQGLENALDGLKVSLSARGKFVEIKVQEEPNSHIEIVK